MESAIENAPDLAIGTAKELIETICATILEQRGITVDRSWDLPQLLKQTTKLLQLTPEEIPDTINAAKSIKSILGSLSTVVQGLSELRNQYGSGHGKKPVSRVFHHGMLNYRLAPLLHWLSFYWKPTGTGHQRKALEKCRSDNVRLLVTRF